MAEPPVLVPVDIPLVGDARHKNWAKVVTRVDTAKSSGWAFEGGFVAAGGVQDVPVGGVLLVYGERGSRANPVGEARVYRINADATLTQYGSASGRAWARTIRDTVEELLLDDGRVGDGLDWSPELGKYTDEALLDELGRRGLAPP